MTVPGRVLTPVNSLFIFSSDPCLGKTCPEYAICEDKSDDTKPNPVCKCTMGYEMNKAKTVCLRKCWPAAHLSLP